MFLYPLNVYFSRFSKSFFSISR